MNKSKLIFVLLTSLALGACSNDDEQVPQQPKSYPLTIEVKENPLIPDGEEGGTATRAAITTNSTLTGFYMDYKYSSTGSDGTAPFTATKGSEGKWSSTGSWPYTSGEVTWYAYSIFDNSKSIQFHLNDGNPYLRFIVEEAAASQHDLLVTKTAKTYDSNNSTISFTFDHACAALRFYVKKATNLSTSPLTVTSIRLCNVKKDGKYYFDSREWQSVQTDVNYTLYSGTAKTINSESYELLNGSEDNSYLFLIPQTLTAWNPTEALSNTYLEVTCSINGGASQTAYIPFGTSFDQGKKYDVRINIGKNSLYNSSGSLVINP